MTDVSESEPNKHTMALLEAAKRATAEGVEYWLARDLGPILGYETFSKFEAVISRASDALSASGESASHHIVRTSKMMGRGGGAQVEGRDYFLSRAASYLIAINGDPSKPEVATAQAYFTAKTRQIEVQEALAEDLKRLDLREKVTASHKRVSSVAKTAGVRSTMQGVFHDARLRGLYGMSTADVKRSKGLTAKDNLFDRVGPLELSANDFQMNLAADVIEREKIKGEQRAIDTNLAVAKRVRRAMIDSDATLPENLPLAEPISEVKKRVKGAQEALKDQS